MTNNTFLLVYVLALSLVGCQNAADTDEAMDTPPPEEVPELITDESAAVPLEALYFTDSVALLPNQENSPSYTIEVQTIIPHSDNAALNRVIQRTLGRAIAGDEYPMVPTDHALHLRAAARLNKRQYAKQEFDSVEVADSHPGTYSVDHNYTSSVYLNEGEILTVGTGHYSHTGGAHGNYDQVLHNFSVSQPQLLKAHDILLPDSGAAIAQMLTDSLGRTHEDLAINIEKPTENIGLLKQGIVFNHPPYEIGPWAAGEIEVIIAYSDLEPYLTEQAKALIAPLKSR